MAKQKSMTPAEIAVLAALAATYAGAASIIAKGSKAMEAAKGKTWGAFKDAVKAGTEAAHNVEAFGQGLSKACADAGVPQGTVNSYLPTARKLYAEIVGGGDADTLLALSIADARKRYSKPRKPAQPDTTAPATGDAGERDGEVMGGNAPQESPERSERAELLATIGGIVASMTVEELRELVALIQPTGTEEAEETTEAKEA